MNSYLTSLLITLLTAVIKVVCLLVAIAYFTLAERKIMAAVQRRVGPNVVGPFGLLQPLADGLKLAGKELAIPALASSRIFLAVSMSVLLFALSGWVAIPFGMFDYSEYMSSAEVVRSLLLTEPTPHLVRFPAGHKVCSELMPELAAQRAAEHIAAGGRWKCTYRWDCDGYPFDRPEWWALSEEQRKAIYSELARVADEYYAAHQNERPLEKRFYSLEQQWAYIWDYTDYITKMNALLPDLFQESLDRSAFKAATGIDLNAPVDDLGDCEACRLDTAVGDVLDWSQSTITEAQHNAIVAAVMNQLSSMGVLSGSTKYDPEYITGNALYIIDVLSTRAAKINAAGLADDAHLRFLQVISNAEIDKIWEEIHANDATSPKSKK